MIGIFWQWHISDKKKLQIFHLLVYRILTSGTTYFLETWQRCCMPFDFPPPLEFFGKLLDEDQKSLKFIFVLDFFLPIIMEAAKDVLPQAVARVPHLTKKILDLACNDFADLTRLRRVSKNWKIFIDSEFLENERYQKAIKKEKLCYPWINQRYTQIEINKQVTKNEKTYLFPINDDSFYTHTSKVSARSGLPFQSFEIFFKERCIGELKIDNDDLDDYIVAILPMDQAQRLMTVNNKIEVSEWELNPNTGHYKFRTVLTFPSKFTEFRQAVILDQPFITWITQTQQQLTIHSIKNSVSSSIELPFKSISVLDVHSNGQGRVFVNVGPWDCSVVVADFHDGVGKKPTLQVIPNGQSPSSTSDYLIVSTRNEVEIMDKDTLTIIARVSKLDVLGTLKFNHFHLEFGFSSPFTVLGDKVVSINNWNEKMILITSFDFKTREVAKLTVPLNGKWLGSRIIHDTLLIGLSENDVNEWWCQCVDLNDLEKGVISYRLLNSDLGPVVFNYLGHNKIIGLKEEGKDIINKVLVWKFGEN